jgi:phosphoribosylamine--glycine ligase
VLNVVGVGEDLPTARARAYAAAGAITFEGKQFRTDIAAPVPVPE